MFASPCIQKGGQQLNCGSGVTASRGSRGRRFAGRASEGRVGATWAEKGQVGCGRDVDRALGNEACTVAGALSFWVWGRGAEAPRPSSISRRPAASQQAVSGRQLADKPGCPRRLRRRPAISSWGGRAVSGCLPPWLAGPAGLRCAHAQASSVVVVQTRAMPKGPPAFSSSAQVRMPLQAQGRGGGEAEARSARRSAQHAGTTRGSATGWQLPGQRVGQAPHDDQAR